MKKLKGLLWCSVVAVGAVSLALAQDMQPPKVLTITREFVKPGKGGTIHDKMESAFVQALARAKSPTHYLGMTSLSGKSRALFFIGYDSFEAWEKDTRATEKNAALSAALDRAFAADGELLESLDQGVFLYNPEYSLNPQPATPATRYLEISVFHVKPGHRKEFDEGTKMVLAAYRKGVPETHWACYESAYGPHDGTYLFITGHKSAAEIDHALARDKDFVAAIGDEGMKKLEAATVASVESSESHLFAVNPRMSYVADSWVTADPDFWKPKAATPAAAAKKSADKKPAAQ